MYISLLLKTLRVSAIVTVVSIAVGYPVAYYIGLKAPERWKNILLVLVVIPFWTSYLLRTFSWTVMLRSYGVVNLVLLSLHLIEEPIRMLYTEFSVVVGLVHVYIAYMILAVYVSVEKLDPMLIEAAQDLGANYRRSFLKVTLPLTMPGIVAGSLLVFIYCAGTFVTPELLGGTDAFLLGNIITGEFITTRDWPFGAALGFILQATIFLLIAVIYKFVRLEEFLGGAER
jgi:spermidine/putrescine transport system permease protein